MRHAQRSVPVVALLVLLFASGGAAQPTAPPQPASGPGGSDYLHAGVTASGPFWPAGHTQQNAFRYFLFEPAGPTPDTAPVVLFLHGFFTLRPDAYIVWIEHMVRKGYVVVWAQYQSAVTFPGFFADNATEAWLDALGRLDTGLHVRPARDALGPKTAIVGHSAGGYLSAILAARAANPLNGIPSPYAIVAVEPGGIRAIPSEDLGPILPDTKMVVVVGDEDTVVCKATAVSLWEGLPQIPAENRNFLLVRSDRHGSPQQIANHFFPTTDGFADTAAVDTRDFFVTFKLSVAALNCAFQATDCSVALGDGAPDQIDMGTWSDGVPVVPMLWVPDPLALQTTCADKNGPPRRPR